MIDKKEPRSFPPAFEKQLNEMRAMGRLVPFLGLLGRFGIGSEKLRRALTKAAGVSAQLDQLEALPTDFHSAFAEAGWLLSESTSLTTAQEALSDVAAGRFDHAENRLASDYEGDLLGFVVMRLRQIRAFRERLSQLQEAQRLTMEGRYLASAPLLLIVADGVGEDAFGKSIFSEGADLEELNSFAGQPDALPMLIKAMCRTRRKTIEDTIVFPYRNGILHGRDLGYGNRLVTAKCWSLLSNLADVIRARDAAAALKPERSPSLGDSIAQHRATMQMKARIEAWTPRTTWQGRLSLFPESDVAFDESTPEAALAAFLGAWRADNFGRMGALTVYFDNRPVNKRAGEIRQLLEGIRLLDAVVTRIEDKAPALAKIDADLTFFVERIGHRTESFTFVMNSLNDAGDVVLRGDEDARWQVAPRYQSWVMGLTVPRR